MVVSGTTGLNGVWGSGPNDVWALGAGGGGGVLVHYDGMAWSSTVALMQGLEAVWGSGPNDIWAVGSNSNAMGTVAHWAGWGGGAPVITYTAIMNTRFLTAVWGSGPNDVWAVGYDDANGLMVHSDGTIWSSPQIISNTLRLDGLWGSGPNDVWAVGCASFGTALIVRWTSGFGALPSVTRANGLDYFAGLWGSGAKDAWAVGGTMNERLALHWDGNAWSSYPVAGLPLGALAIWGLAR